MKHRPCAFRSWRNLPPPHVRPCKISVEGLCGEVVGEGGFWLSRNDAKETPLSIDSDLCLTSLSMSAYSLKPGPVVATTATIPTILSI
jgi:hypothetical protein